MTRRNVGTLKAIECRFADSCSAYLYDTFESYLGGWVFEWNTVMGRRELFQNKDCSW